MEGIVFVDERQEHYWYDSSTMSLKLVFQEVNDSMLKDHRSPSIPNHNDNPTTSVANTENETVMVKIHT